MARALLNIYGLQYEFSESSGEILLQPLLNRIHKFTSDNPRFTIRPSARKCKILPNQLFPVGDAGDLGHDGVFIDGIDTGLLDRLSKHNQFLISIEFTPMFKTSSPSEDPTNQYVHYFGVVEGWGLLRGDWVGGSFLALLMFTVMSGDGPVSGFRFNGFAVGSNKDRRHQSQ